MAIRNVLQVGNEILRKKSKPVVNFDEKLWELLDDMRETMTKNDGCGLAAVQVGILRRAVVLDVNHMKFELINPEIVDKFGECIEKEGCLSVKGESGYVKRPQEVTVKALDRYGNEFVITGVDLLARAMCHEIDHLDGILYIDKLIKDYDKKSNKKGNK